MNMKKGTQFLHKLENMGPWNYPILEYGKRENMKLATWNKVILKFELGNLQGPLGSPYWLITFKLYLL